VNFLKKKDLFAIYLPLRRTRSFAPSVLRYGLFYFWESRISGFRGFFFSPSPTAQPQSSFSCPLASFFIDVHFNLPALPLVPGGHDVFVRALPCLCPFRAHGPHCPPWESSPEFFSNTNILFLRALNVMIMFKEARPYQTILFPRFLKPSQRLGCVVV